MKLFRAKNQSQTQCQPPQIWSELFQKASRSPLPLLLAILTLTSALGYRFYTTPKLDIGKATTQSIYAPRSATVEDKRATEEKRKAVRSDIKLKLIWMFDQTVNQEVRRSLQLQLQQTREQRNSAGPFPYVKTSALSLRVQAHLRKIPESEWQAILLRVDPRTPQSTPQMDFGFEKPHSPEFVLTPDHKQAIAELQAYRRSLELGKYLVLVHDITEARSRFAPLSATMPQPISAHLPASFDASLLDLSDDTWKRLETQVPQIAERMLKQGIAPGIPPSLLEEAIKLQIKGQIPPSGEPFANQLLNALLQPNLKQDEEKMRLQAEKDAQDIQPTMVSIRKGEAIVRQGRPITSGEFALLDHFNLSRRGIDWQGLIGFTSLVSGAVVLVWWGKKRFYPNLRRRDGVLLWLLSVSTPLLVALHLPSTNLPAVGLLIGGFFGAPLGVTATGLLTVLMGVGVEMQWRELLSSAVGGVLCGWLGGRLRSREELAILGVGAGLLQGTVYLLLNVASGTVWYTLLGVSVVQGMVGLVWVIVGMGSSPLLEQVFDLITPMRLVELANPNRPLLKRLANEAPGTFQHTLFVATLAEAAAHALGCNVELVRTGTLYHDIGKMHDPQGFIENQMGGPNKHDLINNPWKSAEIIKKHVSEGLVMARKARLPKAVRAFIPEHQGTMLIAYFYHQAQQQVQQEAQRQAQEKLIQQVQQRVQQQMQPQIQQQGQLDQLGTQPEAQSEAPLQMQAIANSGSHQSTVNPIENPSIYRIVNEADFRYDGPIPQSRETGIVMLADSCEAALRSLKNATYEEALAMINKILRARWQDNQLVESGLTREEMTQIANIFVAVWQQFNHQRIAYPKLSPPPTPPAMMNS